MKKTTKDEYFQAVYKVVHYIIYLVAIIDWYSKKILSYRVSHLFLVGFFGHHSNPI